MTRAARNRLAEATSSGNRTGALHVPQSSQAPHDISNTHVINEWFSGPQTGTAAHDFAASNNESGQRREQGPVVEPPTSLQSSIDAGVHVPKPSRYSDPTSLVSHGTLASARAITNSAPQRQPPIAIRQASIGIRRQSSSNAIRQARESTNRLSHPSVPLPTLDEDCAVGGIRANNGSDSTLINPVPKHSRLGKFKSAIQAMIPFRGDPAAKTPKANAATAQDNEVYMSYTSDMVDVLDTIDPEVATLTSLTNMQNSLFVPNLPFLNRRPTYNLRHRSSDAGDIEQRIVEAAHLPRAETPTGPKLQRTETGETTATLMTIDSQLSESRFAVLPDGASLDGWSKEDKKEVNNHVRHMLHSRRSKFKRAMKGFGQYVRRPLGFLVTLYATLITLFGLAWVLFLIGWVNVGGKQIYVVHIIDSVLVALFAVVGDGLAPFRAIDTYHMIYIAHYHHFTWSRRKKELLPDLRDRNDLPSGNAPVALAKKDKQEDPETQWEFTILTPKQQEKLEHHQGKFCKSHSFYKPHETETHYAFPLRFLIAIVVLLDCHSLLQISLGACTWGIYYKTRPFAITTVILICSITCNATAGLLIWLGDKRTRKKDVVERMNRQELTEEAIREVEKKKQKESESEREDGSEKRERRQISVDVLGGKLGEHRE